MDPVDGLGPAPGRARRAGRPACPAPPGPGLTSTLTRFGDRNAASATECASTGSVLRPLPVAKTRTCADSFAGTSSTVSPLGDQPVRDVPADPVAALDRPDPLSETSARPRASRA